MPGVYSWVPGIQGAVKPAYEPILYEQVYRKQDYLDWFYGWNVYYALVLVEVDTLML